MDSNTWVSFGLVLLFILIGGVFAGTEIALVSLRQSQIDQLEKRGHRGQRVARVARDPNRFLSAVQIGVTVAEIGRASCRERVYVVVMAGVIEVRVVGVVGGVQLRVE